MFANERKLIILELLNSKHSLTVSELMETFNVSIETVRRDLEYLEKQQLLKRVHGGAISVQKMNRFNDVEIRFTENMDQKEELCQAAMQYINEGDTIAIDSGTTAAAFARHLKINFQSLTVITYSSEVFAILSDKPNIKVIITGGQYLPKEKIFCGFLSSEALNKFHFSKSFIVPSALSLKHGAQDFIHEVYENQLSLIRNSNEVYLLADSSKFEKTGNLRLCSLLPEYTIITDHLLPDSVFDLYRKNNLNLIRSTALPQCMEEDVVNS